MSKNTIYKTFEKFDRDAFADWLWRGLRSFYSSPPSERVNAFDYAGLLIMAQESVSEGLGQVYDECVPESQKLMFRQAIGDVLREHGNDPGAPTPAFQDLIYLVVRIRATESLKALLPTIGNGLLGKRYPDILYDTIAALRFLAPSARAYDAALDLIDSPNFDDGYLFEALKVLVECEPSRTSGIVLMFELRLSDLRRSVQNLGEDEWNAFCEAANDWAEHILKLGPETWIKDLWEKANHTPEQSWLFECLFSRKDIPVRIYKKELPDEYFIEYRSKKIPIMVSKKDKWTRKPLILKSLLEETFQWADDPDDIVNVIDESTNTGIHMAAHIQNHPGFLFRDVIAKQFGARQ